MNANEIADELETRYKYAEVSECMLDAATMLRQQQAEIEALKKEKQILIEATKMWADCSEGCDDLDDEYFEKLLGR